jgi:hypothetical protein
MKRWLRHDIFKLLRFGTLVGSGISGAKGTS